MQNGVLKSLSFLFEYIGEMGKDYIYAGARIVWGGRVGGSAGAGVLAGCAGERCAHLPPPPASF